MAIIPRVTGKGSLRYQVKLRRDDGTWFPALSFKHLDEAQRYEAECNSKKRKGGRFTTADAYENTVDQYWAVWAIDRRLDTSEGWKLSQNQMYRDHISPVIGSLKMAEVDKPAIGRVVKAVKDKGLSAQMQVHVYRLCRQLFSDAVEFYEMLETNPVVAKFHRVKVKQQETTFHEPTEAWTFLEFVMDHYAGPGIWLEELAGLRCEAMIGLKWDCVLWEQNEILIRRAWKQKTGILAEYPKGGRQERVPMTPILKAYLWERWLKVQDLDQFVCQGPKGGRISYETFCRVVPYLCKKAGVTPVTPHGLRHSCTELFFQQGAGHEDIRRLLNHRSLSATLRYIHRTDGRLSEIAKNVGPSLTLVQGGDVPSNVPNVEQKDGMPAVTGIRRLM